MRRICKKYQSVFVTDEHENIEHIFEKTNSYKNNPDYIKEEL